jgi:ankyrin repeat protein
MARAAECRSSSCSRLACLQAAAKARVAYKDGIHKAAERGDIVLVQDYLIADASRVNKPGAFHPKYDCTLRTPACTAASALLIPFSNRNTPLHCAARCGRIEVVQLLLSCNADVDARNSMYRPHHCISDEHASLIFCWVVRLIFASHSMFL